MAEQNTEEITEQEVVADEKTDSPGEKKEKWDMSTEEKIETGNKYKEEGNVLFREGKFAEAGEKYEQALGFFYFYSPVFDKAGFDDEVKKGKISLHLNLAACHTKCRQFDAAVDDCNKVLELDEDNVKALFRRGSAESRRQNWEEAIADLVKAAKLEPGNAEIRVEIQAVKDRKQAAKQRERDIYAAMLTGAGGSPNNGKSVLTTTRTRTKQRGGSLIGQILAITTLVIAQLAKPFQWFFGFFRRRAKHE
mmetsp:Transcript_18907/g.31017  ORF Transcript_18907/g.31017 Transcript_18907/m.31017 type:complete len:250 (-) Transcript_18907:266-1015(-)|eukprot:CAMPEP_0184644522 /NCGR_PEP_ID=MMETSP0308-20130426/1228_1 /TAXON_ID=38269 /ORGANISM="Gloeochaete witrockiana, Strain SAG 46.84" /LENGTH=249 /DNA_ID=CAMNT_0027073103 /DNA_START=6 /DNA_END=755 /DNA_ORIENTATION=+